METKVLIEMSDENKHNCLLKNTKYPGNSDHLEVD